MNTNTKTPLTHLELLRKYKHFTAIPNEELRAAQAHIPAGVSALKVLHDAAREYEKEVAAEAEESGRHPNVCFNRNDCDDDHCRCWKK